MCAPPTENFHKQVRCPSVLRKRVRSCSHCRDAARNTFESNKAVFERHACGVRTGAGGASRAQAAGAGLLTRPRCAPVLQAASSVHRYNDDTSAASKARDCPPVLGRSERNCRSRVDCRPSARPSTCSGRNTGSPARSTQHQFSATAKCARARAVRWAARLRGPCTGAGRWRSRRVEWKRSWPSRVCKITNRGVSVATPQRADPRRRERCQRSRCAQHSSRVELGRHVVRGTRHSSRAPTHFARAAASRHAVASQASRCTSDACPESLALSHPQVMQLRPGAARVQTRPTACVTSAERARRWQGVADTNSHQWSTSPR